MGSPHSNKSGGSPQNRSLQLLSSNDSDQDSQRDPYKDPHSGDFISYKEKVRMPGSGAIRLDEPFGLREDMYAILFMT